MCCSCSCRCSRRCSIPPNRRRCRTWWNPTTCRPPTRSAGRCGGRCSRGGPRSAASSRPCSVATSPSPSTPCRSRCRRLLLVGVHRPFSAPREHDEHVGIADATRETLRYARRDRRVWALVSVKFGFGAAAGVLAMIAVFARQVFHAGDVGFGLLMAARGVGALIGPFIGHRLAGSGHRRLLPVIACSLATFGIGYALLGLAPALWLPPPPPPRPRLPPGRAARAVAPGRPGGVPRPA